MTDKTLYYERLLKTREKQLELVLKLEHEGTATKKIKRAAEQLLSLNEAIKEFERQEGFVSSSIDQKEKS